MHVGNVGARPCAAVDTFEHAFAMIAKRRKPRHTAGSPPGPRRDSPSLDETTAVAKRYRQAPTAHDGGRDDGRMSAMSYSGKVHPGGRPDVRELPALMVTKFSVSDMDNNVYLLRCRRTDAQLLVDAADDAARILEVAGADGLASVVTTHRHWDHHRALPAVVAATGAETVAGDEDADELPVPVHRRVEDGDEVAFGECSLEVVRLTGHTPGSIALLYDDPDGTPHLFTGDSLFPGGPGRTTNPTDFTSLMDDLEEKVFARLPDETWFYPGHGDDSTLGEQRPHLGEWRQRGW
jgi:glyoxylase-like metal-dependent hydrolase (beta-lactamase superfamily II)